MCDATQLYVHWHVGIHVMLRITLRSDDATHDATLWRCYTSRYGVLMLHMTLRSDDATLDATLVWCYTPVLSRNVSDPTEHRNVLALHYLNKNPGLNPVLLALFGPVEKVCRTFLHACRLSVKFFQTHRGNVKTNLQTEHDNKEMEMEHSNKKMTIKMRLGSRR